MSVGRVARRPLLHRAGEQPLAEEDVGVLGEEAENQPGHEMVHVVLTLSRRPVRIVLQKLDIEPVQTARRLHIERAFLDLLDRGDPRQRQEETEVVRKIGIATRDGAAAGQVFSLEGLTIRREDELRLRRRRSRAGPQRVERRIHIADIAGRDMDVVPLQHPARNVGRIAFARLQQPDRGVLVVESREELEREFAAIKGFKREV